MHSLFIIAAAVRDWFNQQAEALGNGGVAVSSLDLSANGTNPGTHGWCAVQLSVEKEQAVQALLDANPDEAAMIDWTRYNLKTLPGWPQTRLVDINLKLIEPQLL